MSPDNPNEKFVIIRFVAWGAIHDIGQSGLDLNSKFELVESLSKFAKVPIISKKLLNVLVHNNGWIKITIKILKKNIRKIYLKFFLKEEPYIRLSKNMKKVNNKGK